MRKLPIQKLQIPVTYDAETWPGIGTAATIQSPAVIFFHGYTNNMMTWVPFMSTIAPYTSSNLYSFDLPSHGRHGVSDTNPLTFESQVQSCMEFLQNILSHIEEVTIVAESYGAQVVTAAVAQLLELSSSINHLVLLAPIGIRSPKFSHFWEAYAFQQRNILLPRVESEIPEMLYSLFAKIPSYSPAQIRARLQVVSLMRNAWEVLIDNVVRNSIDSLWEPLLALKTASFKTSIFFGEQDNLTDISAHSIMVPYFEGQTSVSLDRISQCGHSIPYDQPQVLQDFLFDSCDLRRI